MRTTNAVASLALLFLAAAIAPSALAAQQNVAPTATLTVGGKRYAASGGGACQSAPVASIYGTRASMWSVQLPGSGGLQSVSLTVWRPTAGGADQMSLAVNAGGAAHRIDTVKKGARGGGTVGSGTVTMRPQGAAGGRFDIDGRDASGTAIRGSISCPRFLSMEAVGG